VKFHWKKPLIFVRRCYQTCLQTRYGLKFPFLIFGYVFRPCMKIWRFFFQIMMIKNLKNHLILTLYSFYYTFCKILSKRMLQIDCRLKNKSRKNPSMWRAKLTFANNNTTPLIEGRVKSYVVQKPRLYANWLQEISTSCTWYIDTKIKTLEKRYRIHGRLWPYSHGEVREWTLVTYITLLLMDENHVTFLVDGWKNNVTFLLAQWTKKLILNIFSFLPLFFIFIFQ
jgi:hypothetical protein